MKQSLIKFLVFGTILVLGLTGCSSTASAPPDIVDNWQPPDGIDATAVVSCEQNRSLFAYDAQAPLDIREETRKQGNGLTSITLTYASPLGGRVPATLVVPDGNGPFAGLILQHGMPSNRQNLIPMAETYAGMGAVVILIDAPFNRPAHQGGDAIIMTEQDRREQIQIIVDLRRAVDLLLSRPEVDPQRLAYVGTSYGGAMGGLLAGVETRLKGYVLMVGDGGLVTHVTGPEDMEWWMKRLNDTRRNWLSLMWPIEPIHYVGCAAPAALLFQNGTLDTLVPPADALRYQQAGSEPKTIRWYKAGHALGTDALRDQAEWLKQLIGIESYRGFPAGVEIGLIAWSVLIAGSLAYMARDLWRTRPAPRGARLLWILTTVFLGPLGLAIYWISGRQPGDPATSALTVSPARRALGSAAWAAAGNLGGGFVVMGLILNLPQVFGDNLIVQITATFLVPFCVGWFFYAASRWLSRSDARYLASFHRPLLAEMISTCLVLTGAYPMVNIMVNGILSRWTSSLGFDLSYPPLWGTLCLAFLVGALVAFPLHLWLIRRGVIRWGGSAEENVAVPGDGVIKKLAWYKQAALFPLAFAMMLAAIFLSTQIL